MFCGISSFHHIAGDDPVAPIGSKIKKKESKSKSKNKNKNPYSSRGLDKFTSVLSELEARREKIMASTGAQRIAMVRFMYSNSNDWIPIIVRLRDQGNNNNNNNNNNDNNNKVVSTDISEVTSPKKPMMVETTVSQPQPPPAVASVSLVKRLPRWEGRQDYCLAVMMVLILVCLVMFGRVFAICCATIWWYVVPTLEGEEGRRTRRRVSRKADYVKKMSGKRFPPPGTPRAKLTGGGGVQQELQGSPREQSRKKLV